MWCCAERKQAEISVSQALTLDEISLLPEDAVIRLWGEYAIPIDVKGIPFHRRNRLFTAIGTGNKCSQMFSQDVRVFFGGIRDDKEAQGVIRKLAAEFFTASGGGAASFRTFSENAVLSLSTFCKPYLTEVEKRNRRRKGDADAHSQANRAALCKKVAECLGPNASRQVPVLSGNLNCKDRDILTFERAICQ